MRNHINLFEAQLIWRKSNVFCVVEESKLFLNPYDNVLRVVILIIGINKIIMNNLFLIDF